MSETDCKYCGSPFNGDRDENGALFCDCTEAQLERTTARAAELEAELAVACHFKAGDRVEFDYAVLDKIAELEAENKRLREALDAANEDAERLCKLVTGAVFSSRLGYVDTAEGATAYRLHRARVGAKGGDK